MTGFAGVINEQLERVQTLRNKVDPDETPFASKYKAREVLEELLKTLREQEAPEKYLAIVWHSLGVNYVETEELTSAATHLADSVRVLAPLGAEHLCEVVECDNLLGYVWSTREDYEKAEAHLKKSEHAFEEFADAYGGDRAVLDSLHTLTLFCLAQVYQKTEREEESARYCLVTLQRQVDEMSMDWAMNARGLALFYIGTGDHARGYVCLRATEHALAQLPEHAKHAEESANVAMSWGRLYTSLLEDGAAFATLGAAPENVDVAEGELAGMFPSLALDVDVPALPHTFDDARELFKEGSRALKAALEYYVLDGFVTEHVALCRDLSALYKYLIVFEGDITRMCAMHKRRGVVLEPLANALNPRIYSYVRKELLYELGTIYEQSYNLWEQHAKPNQRRMVECLVKALHYFGLFIGAFADEGTPSNEADFCQHLFTALISRASLFGKQPHRTVAENIVNTAESLRAYRAALQFAEEHADELEGMDEHVEMCQTMEELLPLKLQQMRAM